MIKTIMLLLEKVVFVAVFGRFKVSFKPTLLSLKDSLSIEAAVKALVMFPIKTAIIISPNKIQTKAKTRAAIDFGVLSPYLKIESI